MKIVSYWFPPFLWAGLIFTFSSLKTNQASEIYWQEFIIKKTAHIVEYSVFFILLYRAIYNTSGFNRRKSAIISLIILIVYAISDEIHQSFTPGREPTIRDILIDSGAGFLSLLSLWKLLPKAPKVLKTLANNLQIA